MKMMTFAQVGEPDVRALRNDSAESEPSDRTVPVFLMRNDDFPLRNDDFRLKNVDFHSNQKGTTS